MHVVPRKLALDAKIVVAPPDVKVAVHAPFVAVGISNDPVGHIFFIVKTPAY